MERETRVLQKRVQILAVQGGCFKTQERVGREDEKQQKRNAHRGLHPQDARAQAVGKVCSKPSSECPEEREDHAPEKQRAFVITPDTGDLVKHRLCRVAVQRHKADREIRGHERIGERREGKPEKEELHSGGWFRNGHPTPPAFMSADKRHHRLHNGDQKGENQREMTKLYEHGARVFRPWGKAKGARRLVAGSLRQKPKENRKAPRGGGG